MKSRQLLATLCALTVAGLAGCASDQDAAAPDAAALGMLNDTCPISGNAVKSDVETAAFDGQTIGFCCAGCRATWDGKSDAYKEGFVASEMK